MKSFPSYLPRLCEIAKAMAPTHKQMGRHFHVSFLMKKRKIVLIGTNSYDKQTPVSRSYLPTKSDMPNRYSAGIHSEQAVLAKMKGRDLTGHVMVNIRVNGEGNLSLAKPCANCAMWLGRTNIKKIIYTTATGAFEELT